MKEEHTQSGILAIGNNKIHYVRSGQGQRLLLAFPGFGNDASLFNTLLPMIQEEFTLITLHLPGQGRTEWNDPFLEPQVLLNIIQRIKTDFGAKRFSLLGHSLGARIALQVVALQPGWTDKIVLLAPDGLTRNFWYHFATRNPLGQMLFRKILARPERGLHAINLLNRLRLINKSRALLVRKKLADRSTVDRIGYVWPLFSRIIPETDRVKRNLNQWNIPAHIFMGKHDRIFPIRKGMNFMKGLQRGSLHLLNAGHHILIPAFIPEIAQSLHFET